MAASIGKSSGGATSRRFISEELVEEILLRLPVKSMVRFKSVCKRWRLLLNSGPFIELHLERLRCESSSSVHSTPTDHLSKMVPELADLEPSDRRLARSRRQQNWMRIVRLFGPLNNGGIYGVASHLQETSNGRRCSFLTGKLGFCNPATREYMLADPFPTQFHSLLSDIGSRPCLVGFGFGFGFGLDHKAVVVINHGEPYTSFLSFVYSFRTREWRKVVDYERGKRDVGGWVKPVVKIREPLAPCPHVLLQGRWHWTALTERRRFFSILSFDFSQQVFRLMGGAPSHMDRHRQLHYLRTENDSISVKAEVLVLRDRLASVHLYETMLHPRCVEVDVWMMMEYGVEESWTRVYAIQPNFLGAVSRIVGVYSRPDEESDGVHIERLWFEDGGNKQTILCDQSGYETLDACKPSSVIYWNTAGISTYRETLEPLRTTLF